MVLTNSTGDGCLNILCCDKTFGKHDFFIDAEKTEAELI